MDYLKKSGAANTFITLHAKTIDPSFTNLSKTKAARRVLYPDRRAVTDEIYGLMGRRGYRFHGKRPIRDLASALRNSPHFKQDEDGRWYLVDPEKTW